MSPIRARRTERADRHVADPVPDVAEPVKDDSWGERGGDLLEGAADAMLNNAGGGRRRILDLLRRRSRTLETVPRRATSKRSGRAVEARARLSLPHVNQPDAIALFLHGGDVASSVRMFRSDLGYLRMVPFARDVERRSGGRVGGVQLRFAVRGWNHPDKPAVEDALWAIEQVRQLYPGTPLAVIGHSMGGRVVLELAGRVDVDALVALAPWAGDEYDAEPFVGTPLLVIHGRHDTVTDPDASRDLVKRIRAAGGQAEYQSMAGWHDMLWRHREWHRLCSEYVMTQLLCPR